MRSESVRWRMLAIAAAAFACASSREPDAQRQLDQHRRLWERQGIESYRFAARIVCLCPQEFTRPVRVRVRRGEIESVQLLDTGESIAGLEYRTISDLFEEIQETIDDEGYIVHRASYDAVRGYPLEVAFEAFGGTALIENMGATYQIRELEALPDD